MLYESRYNQYFLEHSSGPWKKHLYISRDGTSGRFVYKYPKEYYDKYRVAKDVDTGEIRDPLNVRGGHRYTFEDRSSKPADKNSEYYNEYYNTGIDKVINRSVKKAVDALNFGLDMKEKAEGYLNRFANSVADAWNKTKSSVSSFASKGKSFLSGTGYLASTAAKVVAPKVASSVKNLIEGAAEAVKNTWKEVKNNKTVKKITNAADELGRKVRNTVKGTKARAQGAQPV